MSLIVAIFNFIEIVRYANESLTPWTMLFTHAIKTAAAAAILALDVVAYIKLSEQHYSVISIVVDGILLYVEKRHKTGRGIGTNHYSLITASMLIFAIAEYRRLMSFNEYAYPPNVKSFGFLDRSKSGRSMQKRGSVTPARLSVGSINEPLNLDFLAGTTSQYTHERDTQFEDYMAKRASISPRYEPFSDSRQPEATGSRSPDAMSPDTLSPNRLSPGQLSPPQNAKLFRNEPKITTGAVNTLQRGPEVWRITSWASDHVLMSVPEEEHDVTEDADQVSLLTTDQKGSTDDDVSYELRVAQDVDMTNPRWSRT